MKTCKCAVRIVTQINPEHEYIVQIVGGLYEFKTNSNAMSRCVKCGKTRLVKKVRDRDVY